MLYRNKVLYLSLGLLSLASCQVCAKDLTPPPKPVVNPDVKVVACQIMGQSSLMFKTNDKTIKLTEEGFLSEHFVYNVRDGEICVLANEGEINEQPVIEAVPALEGHDI